MFMRNAFDAIWPFDKSSQTVPNIKSNKEVPIILGPINGELVPSGPIPSTSGLTERFGFLLLLACGLRTPDTPIQSFLPGNPTLALAANLQRFSGHSFCDS